jgi:hypothetical protein
MIQDETSAALNHYIDVVEVLTALCAETRWQAEA